jgi:hypothetical protein
VASIKSEKSHEEANETLIPTIHITEKDQSRMYRIWICNGPRSDLSGRRVIGTAERDVDRSGIICGGFLLSDASFRQSRFFTRMGKYHQKQASG